jgi:3-hydroxyacyl-CoA dehydrogenase
MAPSTPAADFPLVGVIGAGTMGSGIAQVMDTRWCSATRIQRSLREQAGRSASRSTG